MAFVCRWHNWLYKRLSEIYRKLLELKCEFIKVAGCVLTILKSIVFLHAEGEHVETKIKTTYSTIYNPSKIKVKYLSVNLINMHRTYMKKLQNADEGNQRFKKWIDMPCLWIGRQCRKDVTCLSIEIWA